MASNFLTLDVSGRKFRCSKAVLSTSPYFENLFARWEDSADRQVDGSYLIDADPDVFKHLLDFMRRPARFPLYWNREEGFDYLLYSKLEAEADYFMLEDLRDWIQEKKYLEVVEMRQVIHENKEAWEHCSGTSYLQHFILKGAIGGHGSTQIQAPDRLVTIETEISFDHEVLINNRA
ncbi:hypothetical protein ACJQWK_08769 [Exserohilum turcicum]|uniref:BTB domain-containing protein n=1 Tax=Exserohilum turcicum (strain 28A) TaxID=671987 RepID=R0ISH1_EXST2|nr:uncharacterized protein SETTUDRAFT_169005 [Exserohilum turcica Et28A]EOA87586.1 hypothetical protein SETTUDRAFT_169005 [Exserohilum turcica Et28A]